MVIIQNIFAFIVVAYLGISVLLRDPKSATHRLFFLLAFLQDVYIVTNYFSLYPPLPTIADQLIWIRLVMLVGAFVGPTLFLLAITFPRNTIPLPLLYRVGIVVLACGTAFATLMPLVFSALVFDRGMPVPIPGPWIGLYFLDVPGLFIASFVVLFLKYRRTRGTEKIKNLYLFLGISISFLLLIVTTFIAVVMFHRSDLVGWGPFFPVLLVGTIAYAVVKHHFLDMRPFILRSATFLLLIIMLALVAGILFLGIVNHFVPIDRVTFIVFLVVMTIVALVFHPLTELLGTFTNRIFFKGQYNTDLLLSRLTRIMASTIDFNVLTAQILKTLIEELRVTKAALLLVTNHSITETRVKEYDTHIFEKKDFEDIAFHRGGTSQVVCDDLEEGTLKEFCSTADIEVIIPLRLLDGQREREAGILVLGPKASGEPFFEQDLSFLRIVAPQLAIALENTRTVHELMKLDDTKSEFIRVVSHWMRTPLSEVRWNLEALVDDTSRRVPKRIKEGLRTAYHATLALNRGFNDVFTTLEIEKGAMVMECVVMDIEREGITPALSKLRPLLEERGVVIKRNIPISYACFADKEKIGFVIEALLDNAIRYSPPKSVITISVSEDEWDDTHNLVVALEDNGIGIEPENVDLIFKKFFRGEKAKAMSPDGFGLSLFIAQAYIALHKGKLWVQKKETGGSIFSFSIPGK
ncbi:MAG: hypothetical protein KGI50_04965 [Patescibacteria group bacterium]|nr:hypothetical protein [Patescibacteria group bacterium]MDE2438609.1 hypothetical protein [Patescibacteria group bacterium]